MAEPDLAMKRFWLLQALRLSGAAMVVIGAMIIAGRLDQPRALGTMLLVLGATGFFVIPIMLAKSWKNPRQ
ncbi:hypothetical protein [Qipengyuania marisflavi]|uniref:Uncharacterized protein n=1 Tax=Qipengyuania marisflavi TaxID=2486356 RepID=A0A5S3P6U0_9SPHN|nr:hypothetical protein [Qipengyuania marisflavi]TMM48722.1 hypothetical protein FEV51_04815 [Qipengyuania marisflavi]